METNRYFLKLSNKGTNYCGWQIQPNDRTVQGEINDTLKKLNSNSPVLTMGCGRTDTGVHATNFYAHFDFKNILDFKVFTNKMNQMLPSDIVIHSITKVKPESHTRYDATSRTYHYHISTSKNAFLNDTTLYINQSIDFHKMNQACQVLIKYTDFEAFSKVKTDVKTFNCIITEAKWTIKKDELIFTITANRFLRNMVRSIVGTLLDIGQNKLEISDLHDIIKSKNRDMAGKSVSPNGLFLVEIKYPYI